MCEVVLKIKYIAQGEKDELLQMETPAAAAERQAQLESLGTVESITWFTRTQMFQRTVSYTPAAIPPLDAGDPP